MNVARRFGPYFLSIAFLPLLCASKIKAPYGDRFEPQIINTSSMNGWVRLDTPPRLGIRH